ncbi:MAG: isopentenyl-diphosphate Delta-isomerase [Gammaproteobacteria bacterium]|nr:isopentenyl-diphosphate Delta-isomerase [Gammaproteobacteria bacterium]MCW5583420.1 isopentenyl-diphosphate Delta-isomerase [Gammaproteobacteria bacterium]
MTTEYVILVDTQDNEIGIVEKLEAHKKNLLHRAFSVFIFRRVPQLEILLQQRALHKYHSPGLWTNTCCSHPRAGETILAASQRRLKEELGMMTPLTNLGWFQYNAHFANGLSEHEIDHVLVGETLPNQPIYPNSDEVHDYRWITLPVLESEIVLYPEKFTPWLQQALTLVKLHLYTYPSI